MYFTQVRTKTVKNPKSKSIEKLQETKNNSWVLIDLISTRN